MKSKPIIDPARLPQRWASSAPAIKAVQVAFDVSEAVLEAVRYAAFENSLSTSDQVRVVLGLSVVRQAKRPRLTISLNAEDYQVLGKRFGLKVSDHLGIKEQVIATLLEFSQGRAQSAKLEATKHAKVSAKRAHREQS
jgi:hypothetical protein